MCDQLPVILMRSTHSDQDIDGTLLQELNR